MREGLIRESFDRRDWQQFVFAHEEGARPQALLKIEHELSDTEYWKLVRLVWTHADVLWQNDRDWRDILTKKRPERNCMMEEGERAALAELGYPVLIFRGHTERNRDGWSWTLGWGKAKEFAKTTEGWPAVGTPKVTKARVARSKVIAYFNALDEDEILIDPNDAYDQETVTIFRGE